MLFNLPNRKYDTLFILILGYLRISNRANPEKNHLSCIDNWAYADENSQKLQFKIDPNWYGEPPRTYFFDEAHQRTGVSGVLSKKDYDAMLTKILKLEFK